MKLKELHIRNIASIERADIDFENGLNEAATGAPASIFLISGDTGAGKSVILDCIAMALYKKTPRIADVANSTKNAYTDAEGESIRVASIEQYTRLGISEKDESYSEVVFEGNDGKTYHARLTLGMKLGRRDTATGLRVLKHKSPKWEIRIGDEDWTKDSVEQTILSAVGLDFQQFGRIAMLAQGQFANFLTGDKKEREAILEQLINTQHFTAYGEAIQSLYKQAKEALAQVQAQYDTEKPHTLSDEEVEQIQREQQCCLRQKEELDQLIKTTETRLRLIETVLANEQTLAEANRRKQELEARIEGEEYKRCKALFTEWDATSSQRRFLAELEKARQEEARAVAELEHSQHTFNLLTADWEDRQEKARQHDEMVKQIQVYINRNLPHEALFMKAGETDLQIGQYLAKEKKLQGLAATLKEEKDKTEKLKKAEAEAASKAQGATAEVKARQEDIDRLNRRRTDLKPQIVISELKKQNARRQQLADLKTIIGTLKPLEEEKSRLHATLQAEEINLEALQRVSKQADADYQERKLQADKAARRLTTMQMSVDEKIKELRHRLYDNATEHCPLCGQHIQHIHLDDDFKEMLTPLEKEQQEAEESLLQATRRRDQALDNLGQLSGTHKSKLSQYDALNKKIAQVQKTIHEKANQARLDLNTDLPAQIAVVLQELSDTISKLEQTQQEAESLQAEINRRIEAKKPYDKKQREAEKVKAEAENAVRDNAQAIARLEHEQKELALECEAIKADITISLSGYCDDWLTHADVLRRQLKDDARVFAEQQRQLQTALKEQEKANALIASLSNLRRNLLLVCPDWETTLPAASYSCQDISAEWTILLGKTTALLSKLKDNKVLAVSSERALATYYQASGMTEQSLKLLVSQEPQVAESRKFVAEIDTQLQSRIDAIAHTRQQISSSFAALGITDRAELPDRQATEEEKASTSILRDEVLSKMAQAQSRLDTHLSNIRRLREIEAKLDAARQRFARWERLNNIFGGTRFRTLVQTYILRPLLNNANRYLEQITDRYHLTCSRDNEQLAILVLDRYNKEQVRSATLLSGGERFMVSLALSLALSSLNRPDMNVNILFIDEGFGTLDEKSLDSVMCTLEKLQQIAGQSHRRVAIISHREELNERIPVKIEVLRRGEGRSQIAVSR